MQTTLNIYIYEYIYIYAFISELRDHNAGLDVVAMPAITLHDGSKP